MNKELQEKLFEKYPGIFKERHLDKSETCMCWGITCGDGWYNLIDAFCSLILFRQKIKECPPVVFKQVKQKLGALRIYYSGGDDQVDGAYSMIEPQKNQPHGMGDQGCVKVLKEPTHP